MGRPILLMHGNQDPTMSTQILSCFENHGSLSNRSGLSLSDDFGDSTDFNSVELFDSTDFSEMRPVKSLQKASSMKQVSTMKKMPSTKVVWEDAKLWDDTESLGSSSLRSVTEKTQLNEFNRPTPGDRRRPSFYEDFSAITSSKVSRSLVKYDEDLGNIVYRQSPDTDEPIVAVNLEDLQTIKLLGRGQFCNVHSVAGSFSYLQDGRQEQAAAKRVIYALKSINPKRVDDDDELIIAASDLANEAKLLSELNHRNIIKLRGLSCETFSKSFSDGLGSSVSTSTRSLGWGGGRDSSRRSLGFGNRSSSQKSINRSLKRLGSFKDGALNRSLKRLSTFKLSKPTNGIEGYFLMFDVLTEILSDRLIRQRREKERTRQPLRKSYRKEVMYERIEHIVTGIVEGMRYLHSHDIVLRDLKPGNVGFDEEMNVRLFDFGMARKVTECAPDEICGSPRYMAPEIMEGKGYTLKVDVYSFGILLFELCTLEVPFANSCALMRQKQKKKKSGFRSIFKRKPRSSKNAMTFNDNGNNSNSYNCGVESPQANLLIDFYRKVVFDELRPANNNLEAAIPCPLIGKLIQDCWNADPNKRPTFDEICKRINDIFYPKE